MKLSLVSRIGRILEGVRPHLERINNCADKKTKDEMNEKYLDLELSARKIRLYAIIKNVALVLAYATVIVQLTHNLGLLMQIAVELTQIASLLGTSVLLIIVATFQYIISLQLTSATLVSSEIIATSMTYKQND